MVYHWRPASCPAGISTLCPLALNQKSDHDLLQKCLSFVCHLFIRWCSCHSLKHKSVLIRWYPEDQLVHWVSLASVSVFFLVGSTRQDPHAKTPLLHSFLALLQRTQRSNVLCCNNSRFNCWHSQKEDGKSYKDRRQPISAFEAILSGSENEKMKIKRWTSDSTDANTTNSPNPW